MKSIEDQIKFVDKVLLPFFGIKSIIDYESTFEITSEIDLVAFNSIISDFRETFPAKEFSLHKTKYKIETSNQALCLLKKCMDLIQLPYVVETITHNKMSFKQVRLNQTNSNLYKYIQVKMSEIRSQNLLSQDTSTQNVVDSSGNHLINIYRPIGVNTINGTFGSGSKTYDIKGTPPNPKCIVSPWRNSTIEPDVVKVDTIKSTLKNPSHDIRGVPPNPKYIVSPWQTSSYDPDSAFFDLKPPKALPITLQHEDLVKAVESEETRTINLLSSRCVDKDGVCTINLKCCDFYDKYINSIKCTFKSQKINGENIMSKYYIDTIIQGVEYTIYIGGNVLVTGTFYNDKELLPEGETNSKQMFLCNKILSNHEAYLKIKFDKENIGGLKFVDIQLTTTFVNLKSDVDESLVETVLSDPFFGGWSYKKKHNVCGIEQLIKNEKQLWNKARLMSGMHGNAFMEFLEKDHMEKLSNHIDELKEKPKQTIKIGNLNGYRSGHLEIPVDNYHFCCTMSIHNYSHFDNTIVTYSYKQLDSNKFVHHYELQYEKINMFRYGELNPRDVYGIGDIMLSFDTTEFNTLNLYAIMIKKVNTIEIQKIKLECNIACGKPLKGETSICPTQYLCIMNNKDFRGFLLEVVSNTENEPIPKFINLDYTEYAFCSAIRRQLAQHNVILFDLEKINANTL
jgi:hypothetical protein